MHKLTAPLILLLAPFSPCFNKPVHDTFCLVVVAWALCLGRRTISRIWQTTGLAADHDHSRFYRFFNQAIWNWDEIARIFLVDLFCEFVPGTTVWLVIDDTLCHKRGAKVAFGGIFLDAVLSTRSHKIFRYGVNWVTLGLVVQLPFRKDRFFCINLLWRVYSKRTKGLPHQTKSMLARQMLDVIAIWLPNHTLYFAADCAYVGKHLLKCLPDNVHAIGPIHPKACLTHPLPEGYEGKRKKGDRLPTPREMMESAEFGEWDDLVLPLPNGTKKKLKVKVLKGLCWYDVLEQRKIQLVLLRDESKKWRDELLLCTDLRLSATEVVLGYMRRWSVEVCYWESKQLLGLHDAQVWTEKAVQRAHTMAWFVGGLILLWYAKFGVYEEQAEMAAPWYTTKKSPTFSDMLATFRLYLWRNWWDDASPDEQNSMLDWLFHYISTATG
jgi:DDE superfamily endonuclease